VVGVIEQFPVLAAFPDAGVLGIGGQDNGEVGVSGCG
jgi:hypothetical protein